MSQRIVPCVWLDDQAEEAARVYAAAFAQGRVGAVARYPRSFDNPAGRPRGSVVTVEVELAGTRLTLLNGGPLFQLNPSVSLFVFVDAPAEAERLHGALAEGGEALMPLGEYPWSPCYAWIRDRFGVSWQVYTGSRDPGGPALAPCLMFAGPAHGRAGEALERWAAIFPRGRVTHLARYEEGEGPAGTVKHGRAALDGQTLIAMDSHLAHGITFNEALSLQVLCADQAELDRTWAALADGGREGPCGWLTDRFGVSWQVVPERLTGLLASEDEAGRERAFRAMLEMGKLDLAALQAAFAG